MTATIRPPEKGPAERRGLRLSSMEILGFSDSSSTWSDTPPTTIMPETRKGRHETTVADVQPHDFGGRLTGSNVRWGLVTVIVVLLAGVAGLAFWLYQRPVAQEQATLAVLDSRARALAASLPGVERSNEQLLDEGVETTTDLSAVEAAARTLFETSGELGDTHADLRSAASRASNSALDAIRLATEARSYRAAVIPQLQAPDLETDPEVIALDEAARQFGDWQLGFDQVRGALPEGVLSDVTQQLDILSGDLVSILGRYVDALRQDDTNSAETVLADLGDRLSDIEEQLETTTAEVQVRIADRIDEARAALDRLVASD